MRAESAAVPTATFYISNISIENIRSGCQRQQLATTKRGSQASENRSLPVSSELKSIAVANQPSGCHLVMNILKYLYNRAHRTWHMSFVLALARTTMERLLERVLTDTGARTAAVFVAKDIIVSNLSVK